MLGMCVSVVEMCVAPSESLVGEADDLFCVDALV